jgi:hypothetical protein
MQRDERRGMSNQLLTTVAFLNTEYLRVKASMNAIIASALVHSRQLPDKLTPIIKPLMEGIRKVGWLQGLVVLLPSSHRLWLD